MNKTQLPGRYPAIVKTYSEATRTCEVEIPGITSGGDSLMVAEINYPIGDRSAITGIEILPNDTVWIEFIGGMARYPIITGYRNPESGNSLDWRKTHHKNIEFSADSVFRINASTVEINAANINFVGNVRANGTIIDDTHTHGDVQSGSSSTSAVNGGAGGGGGGGGGGGSGSSAWVDITGKPTTLSGYGITDAVTAAAMSAYVSSAIPVSYSWSSITSKPTTLSGYGITDALTSTATIALIAASVVATLDWSTITSKPTTIGGYGITNAYTKSEVDALIPTSFSFSTITSKPTTLSGYGITDAYTKAEVDGLIPSSYAWSAITSTPTTLSGYGITSGLKTINGNSIFGLGDITISGGGGGLTYFLDGANTTAPNDIVPIHYLSPVSTETDVDVAIIPKGNGSITSSLFVSGSATLLDKCGYNSVNLQLQTTASDQVPSSPYGCLIGGYGNAIEHNSTLSSGWFSVIIGGSSNKMALYGGNIPQRAVIIGGQSNVISSYSDNSVILGGTLNSLLDGASQCAILGGSGSTITSASSCVVMGTGVLANKIGAVYIGGSSNLGVAGDSQSYFIKLSAQTTGAGATLLTAYGNPSLNYNTAQMEVIPNGAIVFVGEVVAKQQNSTNGSAWKVEGWAVRSAAGTVTIKAQTITAFAGNIGWSLALAADSVNGVVKLTFTGAAATNIKVVASIKVTETINS